MDDDDAVRNLYVTMLEEIEGVGTVVGAADGAEAVQLVTTAEFDVAIVDLNMPRLDGVEAAIAMAALQPALAIALQSSDPDALRHRAGGRGLALFDKLELERVIAWVGGEVARRRESGIRQLRPTKRDLSCSRCGYGVATGPPSRCPMCNRAADWVEAAAGPTR